VRRIQHLLGCRSIVDVAFFFGLCQVFDGDVKERTVEFAQRLADTVSPTSMAAMKRQLWEHPRLSDEEALRQSTEMMV
jgi:enoyl-CoA hydratase/carnithine racemase